MRLSFGPGLRSPAKPATFERIGARSLSDEKGLNGQDVAPVIGTYDHNEPDGQRPAALPLRRLSSWRTWVTAVPATFTLVVGGAYAGRASMWSNEAATWISSIQPVSRIVSNSSYLDGMYLPYYLFMHFWLLVSQSMWWMRLPSLLSGAAAVAALVLLARRWLPLGWSVVAGFLLALNPEFAQWTIEARPYPAAALFAVLSTAALVNAIERGGRRRWVFYGLASVCMLLLHLLAVFVLVAQVVAVAVTRRRSALAGMVATLGCVAVAVSPLAVVASRETKQISWIAPSTLGTFHTALKDVSGGRAEAVALVICVIIVTASLATTRLGSHKALGFALSLTWGTVPALLLILAGFAHPLYVPRYTIVSLPGIALIEAMAGWRVSTILTAIADTRQTPGPRTHAQSAAAPARRHERRPWTSVTATIICAAACVASLAFLARHISPVFQKRYYLDDYRTAAAALSSDLSARPAPVAIIPIEAGIGFSYYATPLTLAHALSGPAISAYNRHMLYWLPRQPNGVVSWPIGVKPEAAPARCAVGWALGRGAVPSKAFIIDGTSCQVYQIRHYGSVWVASVRSAAAEVNSS